MKPIDQRIFDWFVNTAHQLMDKGYVGAWFSWLQWILVTGLIAVAAKKAHSLLLYGLTVVCALLLFFVGLAGVEKLLDDLLPKFKGNLLFLIILSAVLSAFGLEVVISVLFTLLPVSAT